MANSSRHGPSGFFMALVGLCVIALFALIIYGTAISNPDLVKLIIGEQGASSSEMGELGANGEFSDGDMSGGFSDSGMVENGGMESSGSAGGYSDTPIVVGAVG